MPGSSIFTGGLSGGGLGVVTDGIASDAEVGVVVLDVQPQVVSEEGGDRVVVSGSFAIGIEHLVELVDPATSTERSCWSGVPGSGSLAQSTDGATLSVVVPPFPEGGAYDLRVTRQDTAAVGVNEAVVTVVRRTYSTNLYAIRGHLPPPRDAGPRSPQQEAGPYGVPAGLYRAILSAVAEETLGFHGLRLTRTTTAASAGDTTLNVQSTYGFPSSGRLATAGGVTTYSGLTATTFTGISLPGDVAPGSTVADVSGSASAVEQARMGLFLDTADRDEIYRMADNAGVVLPYWMSTTVAREVLRGVAEGPAQTVQALDRALLRVFGAGNYELWEDLEAGGGYVHVRITGAVAGDSPAGKAYLATREEVTSDTATQVTLSEEPVGVYGVHLVDDYDRRGTDYSRAPASFSTDAADPTYLTINATIYDPADVGRWVSLPRGTVGTETWRIVSLPGAAVAELSRDQAVDGRLLATEGNVLRTDGRAFQAWMLGHAVRLAGLNPSNSGTFVIAEVISSRAVRLTGGAFSTEVRVAYTVVPQFPIDLFVGEILDRATVAGAVVTLPQALPSPTEDVVVSYSVRPSAQLMPDAQTDGTPADPLYLFDLSAMARDTLDLVRAAGIRVAYEE